MKQNWFDFPTNLPPEFKDPMARSLLRANLLRLMIVALVPGLAILLLSWLWQSAAPGITLDLPILLLSLALAILLLLSWFLGKSLSIALLRALQTIFGLGIILLSIVVGTTASWQLGPSSLYLLALVGVFSVTVQPLAERLVLTMPSFIVFAILLAQSSEQAASFWGTLLVVLAVKLFLLYLSQKQMSSYADSWTDQVLLADLKNRVNEINQRDSATGLYNRLTIRARLTDEIARANRFKSPLCILTIDIDDLDFINKQHGTAIGDLIIQTVAHALAKTMRATDVIGRHGSDEFVVILPNTNLENAKIAIRRIQDAVAAIDPGTTGQVTITISGGLSQHKGEQAETMIVINDARLRQAKSQGKNQFVME